MNRLYMMVGLPASGKSSIAKTLGAKVFSSDDIREEWYGDSSIQGDNNALFKELHSRIRAALVAGDNVVYDATNLNYKRRRAYLETIKDIKCEKIAYVCMKTYPDCLEDNKFRDRFVPEYVMKKMYKSFVIPQYFEGWDNIIANFHSPAELVSDCEQDNPHHSRTVFDHCRQTAHLLSIYTSDETLLTAAKYHDIGKPFTKEFVDSKGNLSEHAHFYEHHTVGAYIAYMMTHDLEVARYIQWHMQPFFSTTEKSINKYKSMLGEEFWENLMLLHDADVKAH